MDREIASMEITKFELVPATRTGHDIVITMVKALDEEGKYIKFLPLREAFPLLGKLPLTWRGR